MRSHQSPAALRVCKNIQQITRHYLSLIALVTFLVAVPQRGYAVDRVSISGKILFEGTPLCALVLANGQHMFSCSGNGEYNLTVPLDSSGTITLFAFASGFSPFRQVLTAGEAAAYNVGMVRSDTARKLAVTQVIKPLSRANWVNISGTVQYDGSPLCTMALANGQQMFTCGNNLGLFSLDVPLDSKGEITLFNFASGFAPSKKGISGGGNTGAGGNAGAGPFKNRVTRVDYDYDNNGTSDATDTISYDANGRVKLTTYLYRDDGTPDKLNLRDSGTTRETDAFTYDSTGNVTSFIVDRQSERIEANSTYDASGLLTRVDFQQLNARGGQVGAAYWTFAYTSQQLDKVDNFISSTNQFFNSQSFTYDANGLPATSIFSSSGINATTTYSWRSDGQLDALVTQNDNGASSRVTLTYNAQGLQTGQVWTNSGSGFGYSEILARNYTRSITYDAQKRPLAVSYDQDSDGSVDATFTLTWESAPCIPATLWAPNGFPNFVKNGTRPFIPGTGFFITETCAP